MKSIVFGIFAWFLLLTIFLQHTNAMRSGKSMHRFRRLQEESVENSIGVQPVSDAVVLNDDSTSSENTLGDAISSTDPEISLETTPTETSTTTTTTTTTPTEATSPTTSASPSTTTTTPTVTDPSSSTTTTNREVNSAPVNSNSMSQALISAQRLNGEDKEIPLLRSFTCDRTTVSVINTKSSIRCVAEAFDEGSGVEYIYGAFYNTQGTRKIPFYFSEKSKQYTDPNTMISTFAMDIPIPSGIDNGIWTVGMEGSYPKRFINLEVGDYEGNVHSITKEDIKVLGDSLQLDLTILSDPNPAYFLSPTRLVSDGPLVKAVYCQDETIDLKSSIIFRCFARIKPDNYGVKRADAVFVGPNNGMKIPFVFDGESGFLRDEDDGTITLFAEQYIPFYADSGKYSIETTGALRVTATSKAGVIRPARESDIEYSPSFIITSNTRDILPPEIISFKCNTGKDESLKLPEKSGEVAAVKCSLDVMDRVSGIQSVIFEFVDPSKEKVLTFSYVPPARGLNYNLDLYNDLRIEGEDTIYFDNEARRGAYILRGATVTDNAGNTKSFLTSQLNEEYIQTYFMVDVPSQLITPEGQGQDVTSPASTIIFSKYLAIAAFLGGIAFQMLMF